MMTKQKMKEEIFAMYLATKKLLEENPNDRYWFGSESQAWHTIYMLDLADEYFDWEKENADKYF